MAMHTGEKPFCCEVCSRTFSWNLNTKEHMAVHTGKKPFCCKMWGVRFFHNSSHKKYLITYTCESFSMINQSLVNEYCYEIILLSCRLCNMVFSCANFKFHVAIHTGLSKEIDFHWIPILIFSEFIPCTLLLSVWHHYKKTLHQVIMQWNKV